MSAARKTPARKAPAKRTNVTGAEHTPTVKVEASSPPAKRAKRLDYPLPEVPADVVLEEQSPKLVTVEKDSALAKRAKRKGYELPESPETVVTETSLSVPLGSGDKA